MPELPDIELYISCLRERVLGEPLEKVRIFRPFVLRSVEIPPSAVELRCVDSIFRIGKRIVLGLQEEKFLVLHLMISGRLLWKPHGAKPPGKIGLAAFDFATGTLMFTEASTKKRASLHIVQGREALKEFERGGLEITTMSIEDFEAQIDSKNQSIKRALTDPALFSGIGNAYSDEILFEAKISPHRLTSSFSSSEKEAIYHASVDVLKAATEDLIQKFKGNFPESKQITAFRPEHAVHGKYGQPCRVCGKPIQRIVRADNEINYCAQCQNGGKILADRALSRLLKDDFQREFTD